MEGMSNVAKANSTLIKLKETEYCDCFEVVEGKDVFVKYINNVGYSNTFNKGINKIPSEWIKKHNVVVCEGDVYLDYNEDKDLVFVGRVDDEKVNVKYIENEINRAIAM